MTEAATQAIPRRANTLSRIIDMVGPLLALIGIYLFFAVLIEFKVVDGWVFFSERTLRTISTQTVVVALSAMGMTLILISAGIDLSIGSIIALSCVTVAYFLKNDYSTLVSAAAGIGIGTLCGFANGLMVTKLKIVPFIVTLGTLGIYRGLALFVAKEQTINSPETAIDKLMYKTPDPEWLILSPAVWLTIFFAVAMIVILRRTVFGVQIYAIGSSEETARLCGLRVNRIKILVYSIGGMLGGFSGLMQYSYLSVGDPTTAVGYELDVIAAVVIGGGSLSGGVGSIVGTIVGALIMTTLRMGSTMMGWPNYWQMIIVGAIIIFAVFLDRLRHKTA